jgi:hypothetical protein
VPVGDHWQMMKRIGLKDLLCFQKRRIRLDEVNVGGHDFMDFQ